MNLNGFKVTDTETFLKEVKKLSKRYKHINDDINAVVTTWKTTEDLSISLGNNIYKLRIANSDKQKGKSAGYRLISYVKIVDNEILLVYIYDKSDLSTINEATLDKLITENS